MNRIALTSLAALACALSAAPALAQETAPPAEAVSAEDWGKFGVATQYIDTSVEPGDDFDAYVNGLWAKQFEIPADRTTFGAFDNLELLSEARVHAILEEIAASNPAPGTPRGKIAAAYAAFMDTDRIEAAGLAPLQPYLARIAAAKTSDDLLTLFAEPGFASPIGGGVGVDAKASDRYAFYISQGGLGLPDRDYYLVDSPRNLEIRAKYLDWLTFALGQAGYADARGAARGVLALETKLAGATWDRALSRNRNLTYNKMPVSELAGLAPSAHFARYLDAAGVGGIGEVIVRQVPPTPEEVAAEKLTPAMSAKLGGGVPETLRLVASEPVSAWQAWLASRLVSSTAAYLPKAIDDARFAFYGRFLQGQPEQRVRWKRAIDAVEGQVGELLGQVYAERYFPAENKAAMANLVANLRRAMAANLGELKWMSPATRREAVAKLDAFTPKIGAPDEYKTYEGLTMSADNPLANSFAAAKWDYAYDLARLGGPVDRKEWGMFPETVNAYYNSTLNEIVFPAAILQPPFFNLAADPAVNYGAIGAVIGHEMGHGFDDQGSKSDGTGNLRNWWSEADRTAFDGLTARLGAQYNALCPFDEGKTCVNGQLTMGENIGDLGGLSLAYRAYKMSLGGKPAPVIDGVTGDQRFFMAYAQVWRSKEREAYLRQQIQTNPHSPAHYRINAIVRNFDEWYKAFGVKPGDDLYLPPEQRVRIW
ncbi:MAG TPA: M13 family metallopeptidase [Novosphingobium sp.]|nr:M13 family metallopeptidase [Novosphingobium sp.]